MDKKNTDIPLKEYLDEKFDDLKADIKDIKDNSVTQAEFKPVKDIVYGAVKIILTFVLGGILGLSLYVRKIIGDEI